MTASARTSPSHRGRSRIELEGVMHHGLRNTGASAMVAAGISLRVVQDIGGWSTLRMLERYAHPSGTEMARAVRVLTQYTATGTKTGTVPKIKSESRKRPERVSAVQRQLTKWRPQCQPVGTRSPAGSSR